MARPKKKVLLFCYDDNRRAELSCLFTVRCGYEVLAGISAWPPVPDVAVIVHDDKWAPTIANTVDGMLPDVPILILLPNTANKAAYPLRSWYQEFPGENIHMVERVKVLVARKRGPKRGSVAVTVSAAEVVTA